MMSNSRIASPVDETPPAAEPREAYGVRGACARFGLPQSTRQRKQAPRTLPQCGTSRRSVPGKRPGGSFLWFGALAVLLAAGCAAPPRGPEIQSVAVQSGEAPARTTERAALSNFVNQWSAHPSAPFEGEGWQAMTDSKTLSVWRETAFDGHGEVRCQSGAIMLGTGDPCTGINCTTDVPSLNYA